MFEAFLEGGDLDKVVHFVSFAFSFFLFVVSYRYYRINCKRKFLYVLLAFLFFSITELLVFLDITFLRNPILTSVSHSMVVVVLVLFFMGTVRK